MRLGGPPPERRETDVDWLTATRIARAVKGANGPPPWKARRGTRGPSAWTGACRRVVDVESRGRAGVRRAPRHGVLEPRGCGRAPTGTTPLQRHPWRQP